MRTTQLFRRLIAATISAGAALVLSGAAPAHASDAPPPPIVWERISAYHSGLVLAVPPPYTQNDLQVVQQVYNPNATAAQWKTKPVGPNGDWVQFENRFSHQCLGIPSTWALYGLGGGAPVVQQPCANAIGQYWIRVQDANLPVWHIFNLFSFQYMGVANGSQLPGAGFVQTPSQPVAAYQMIQMY